MSRLSTGPARRFARGLAGALRRALIHALAAWLAVGLLPVAHAADAAATDAPQLRIEPDAHTALIRETAFDAARQRIYSVADDKTVRVWQLPRGQLVETWRVPIAAGHEGQLFGVSISPDGRQLAVGGWTCWTREQISCVYLLDTQTGLIVRRLPVAPHTITSLRFSPDGKQLAVGLHGMGGLAVLDMASGRVIATDGEYRGKLMGLEFDRHGRLVTTSLDGFVRYYRADYSLLARRATRAARAPTVLDFSPDGSLLAIGFLDAPVVELLRADDLESTRTLTLPAARMRNAGVLAWTDDGRQLVVSGEARGLARQTFARFRTGRWDAPVLSDGPLQRVDDLLAIGGARMLFTSEEPGLGWIDAAGALGWISRPAVADFSAAARALQVSADGEEVSLPAGRGAATVRYAVRQARLRPGRGAALLPPRTAAPGIEVRLDRATPRAEVNGRAVALDEAEEPRQFALSHDAQTVYIGTEWALHAVDTRGVRRWVAPLVSRVHAINATADGRLVLLLLGDGTLRWLRSDDGSEVLALFLHANREDWIAWTPAGHYTSSPSGDQFIGWHMNRGPDTSPDFIRAVQLERVLYRPDLVSAALDAAGPAAGRGASAREPALQLSRLQRIAPPRVQVQAERAAGGGPGMQDLAVYVNDIPVLGDRQRLVGRTESNFLQREFKVPLSRAWNDIRVEAFTESSIGLARTGVELPGAAGASTAPPGDLYVLAVGASRFDQLGPETELAFAAKDAEVLADELDKAAVLPFRQRHVQVLSDGSPTKPTRANIVAALDFLAQAQANDTVLVFLASHGVADAAGNYYFVPSDARRKDIVGRLAAPEAPSLLSWQVFFDALRRAAGRRVLVVDTCSAKGIAGPLDASALIKRSASSHFALMLASGESEESQEYEAGGHGLFTYGLLSVLRAARQRGDGSVATLTLDAWFQEALPVVRRLRDRRIGPQTPQLLAPPSLRQMPLAAAAS